MKPFEMNHFYSVMLNYSYHAQAVAGPAGRDWLNAAAAAASHAATQVSQSTLRQQGTVVGHTH